MHEDPWVRQICAALPKSGSSRSLNLTLLAWMPVKKKRVKTGQVAQARNTGYLTRCLYPIFASAPQIDVPKWLAILAIRFLGLGLHSVTC